MSAPGLDRLVAAASSVIAEVSGSDAHTVAAAVLDERGDVHAGVNVAHFTGGPCAELVALGAAAAAGAGRLVAMVAVGDEGRGVLAPCGRCRQVMLDLHPAIGVVVPLESGGLALEPVESLLPFSYRRPDVAGTAVDSLA